MGDTNATDHTPDDAAVRFSSVTKTYGSGDNMVAALRDVSLALRGGSSSRSRRRSVR